MRLTINQRTAMQDYAQQSRQQFIARASDPYADKRDYAIAFLRSIGRYVLDADSRAYVPMNKRFPQAVVEMRSSL